VNACLVDKEGEKFRNKRILQIHPTLICNLSCRHCYSASGPSYRQTIAPEILCEVISDAAEMGYKIVSISGGEPLLYPAWKELLTHARNCKMKVGLVTNGTLLHTSKGKGLLNLVDVLAVSIDGPPEIHNQIRKSPLAFDQMQKGVNYLRSEGADFGFIHTLTRKSWEYLFWLADFTVTQGASLLQLHPLEMSGRGMDLSNLSLSENDQLSRAFILSKTVQSAYSCSIKVQIDIFQRSVVDQFPELIYAEDFSPSNWDTMSPADLIDLLVVEEDGSVVPVSYGMDRDFAICNIYEIGLKKGWERFLKNKYLPFREMCQSIHRSIARNNIRIFNWHEYLVKESSGYLRVPKSNTLVE